MIKITRIPGPGAEKLKKLLDTWGNKVGKVGWFPSAKYDSGIPVAYVASIQEFKYPERSFMRTTIAEKQKSWGKLSLQASKAILAGNETGESALDKIGYQAENDISAKIESIQVPPLSPHTIYARLHRKSDKKTIGLLTKPLIDTGILFKTLSHEVSDK
jgi:hypothetical protein